jgi:hypothetical protein
METNTARNAAEQMRIAGEKELNGHEAAAFVANAKFAEIRLILVTPK